MTDLVHDVIVKLPDAPPIPGLRFRRWHGLADLPSLVSVCTAANLADGETESVTLASMTVDYTNPENCDLDRDLLLAEVDGAVVAYGRVYWEDFNDGTRAYHGFGFVHPEWRRRGIGRAMLRANERRSVVNGTAHGDARTRFLMTWGPDSNTGLATMARQEGYREARHFFRMVRPTLDAIEVAPLPGGLEIRPATVEQARQVHDGDAEAFRDHWGGIDDSEAALRRWMGQPTFDPGLWVVAWEGDQVAGAVINIIDPVENEQQGYRRGWLDSVYVRRPWRRRGLASALIGRSLVLLRERGMDSAQLGVDAENPHEALGLYAKAGFAVASSDTAWRKEWPTRQPAAGTSGSRVGPPGAGT